MMRPNDSTVYIHTDEQLHYLYQSEHLSPNQKICPFDWSALCKPYVGEHSRPEPTVLSWEAAAGRGRYYEVRLSRRSDMSEPDRVLTVHESKCSVDNLFIATRYYWQVRTLCDGREEAVSPVATFVTEATPPRNVRVPSISNVRDLGGWKTVDGRRIRQGCMYRSSEYNDHNDLSREGARVMTQELGIRVDMDIRSFDRPYFDKDVVRYEPFGIGAYGGILGTLTPEVLRRMYTLMLNSPNEPLVLHCWGGADRAGSLVFILNGLLGVPYHDLCTDFEFTGFSVYGERCRFGPDLAAAVETLRAYGGEGDSINTCIENFFIHSGISKDEIELLRDTLTERIEEE